VTGKVEIELEIHAGPLLTSHECSEDGAAADGTISYHAGEVDLTSQESKSAVIRTARDLWLKGWAERNAGNLSVRLLAEELDDDARFRDPWRPLGTAIPDLAGEHFLFTDTGSYMRLVELDPQRLTSVIELDTDGERFRVMGEDAEHRPTSELVPHLCVHAARKRASGNVDRAVIHTHPPNLIALTYSMALDTPSLSRLLWQMHTECIVVFPKGCGFVDWRLPGSEELARATERVMERRSLALWQYHGIVATGPDLDVAFGLIETAEKAAEIYLKAASVGPVERRLSDEQLHALASRFGVEPDEEILAAEDAE
jgi:rhamnulose-1-phosphate aldolase